MLTSAEIAALEEPRQAALLAAVTPLVRPFAGGVMGFHEPGSWQNQACGVGLTGPVRGDEIDELVEFYVSRGVEPRVELSPFCHETLLHGLADRGFVVREFENVLARELPADEPLDRLLADAMPEGLELDTLDREDTAAVDHHVEIVLRGFFPTGELPISMVDACRTTTLLPSVHTFIARLDGQIVSGGSVALGHRVASLMGVSTVEQFRRRGIQRALIWRRLELARAHGCVLATVGSRPGIPTERNAARVGFCVAYTKVVVVQPGPGRVPSH